MKKNRLMSLVLALIMLMSIAACTAPAAQPAEEPAARGRGQAILLPESECTPIHLCGNRKP